MCSMASVIVCLAGANSQLGEDAVCRALIQKDSPEKMLWRLD